MSGDFVLLLNNEEYRGWKDLSINRSMEEVAHSFAMTLTTPFAKATDYVKVMFGEPGNLKDVTTGYIDEDNFEYSKDSRLYKIAGRSQTGDLIDCVAKFKKGGVEKLITLL